MERSLILLKPDALDRGIVGQILSRFEKAGIKIVGLKMLVSEKDTALKHYTDDLAQRRGEKVRQIMVEMITSGPIVAMVVEGVEIVEVARKLVGETEPKKALPGTIRGDFSFDSQVFTSTQGGRALRNVVHVSGDTKEALTEIEFWFGKDAKFSDDYIRTDHLAMFGEI